MSSKKSGAVRNAYKMTFDADLQELSTAKGLQVFFHDPDHGCMALITGLRGVPFTIRVLTPGFKGDFHEYDPERMVVRWEMIKDELVRGFYGPWKKEKRIVRGDE